MSEATRDPLSALVVKTRAQLCCSLSDIARLSPLLCGPLSTHTLQVSVARVGDSGKILGQNRSGKMEVTKFKGRLYLEFAYDSAQKVCFASLHVEMGVFFLRVGG
jgi:hypothetical protein